MVQPGDPMRSNRRVVEGIDLDRLNERLNDIPVEEIQHRRTRMNVFYEELLLSADPDRGISFTSTLMILAHYNVIQDTKSLRLEEFLRRRARLQRVHESIRRDTVIGFFDTVYWSRRFRRSIAARKSARMDAPPQIPEIFIENPDDSVESSNSTEPRDFVDSVSSQAGRKTSPVLPRLDTSMSPSSGGSHGPTSLDPSPSASPNLSPTRLRSVDTSYPGATRSSPTTPTRGHSRQTSGVSALDAPGVMESFDSSAWGESIRRSFTMRRPRQT